MGARLLVATFFLMLLVVFGLVSVTVIRVNLLGISVNNVFA